MEYNSTIEEKKIKSVKYGLKAMSTGFVLPSFFKWETKYYSNLKDVGFNYLIERYFILNTKNKQLTERILQLEIELTEERLRPPEYGGSEYEKTHLHFNKLCQQVNNV